MTDKIASKVVVITGASSGAGEATARHLAALGAAVVVGARRSHRIDALTDEIRAAGGRSISVATDVTSKEQVRKLVDTAVREFGRIDVLLNNAGVMPLAPLDAARTDEWDHMIDVNLKGTLYGIAAALPHMKSQKCGHIMTVSSVYGHVIGPNAAVYCATKFGVRALTEGLRQEVKPYNIRTTIISPGAMSTELQDHIGDPQLQSDVRKSIAGFALPPSSFARMVAFAINEPDDVDVSEILFRPTAQPR
jgi:NADP-dependent 3-hydroxy acid dehydrogenase YdfG